MSELTIHVRGTMYLAAEHDKVGAPVLANRRVVKTSHLPTQQS